MTIFGDLAGRIFPGYDLPEPAISGPILGKRKASGSSEQSSKRIRRDSGYAQTDYTNVDLDVGILGRAGLESFEFTPRKVRSIRQATGAKRTAGESFKSGYRAAADGLTAGSLGTPPRAKRGYIPTTPKGPSYTPTPPKYGSSTPKYRPLTPKKGISAPKYTQTMPPYAPTKPTYGTTSSKFPDSGLGDDATGLGIAGIKYRPYETSPTPYHSLSYDNLQQKPYPYVPGFNDSDSDSNVSYPNLDSKSLGAQSIHYPFTTMDQEILDMGSDSSEDEYSVDDMELVDDEESEVEILPITSRSPPSKGKGKSTSTKSPVTIKPLEGVGDNNEPENEDFPIIAKTPPSKGKVKATSTRSPVVIEQPEKLLAKTNTSTPVTTSTRFETSPKVTSSDPWISSTKSPNTMANEILSANKNNVFKAKIAIKNSLIEGDYKPEPEYAFCDVEIRDGLWWVMDLMERFATKYFKDGDKKEVCTIKLTELTEIFRLMKLETVKVIGCVASGGPGDEEGWQDLFTSDQKRRALINAIVGNVLTEQVFQHPCFGSGADTQAALKQREKELKSADGRISNQLCASSSQL
jgi:hypothetical protein